MCHFHWKWRQLVLFCFCKSWLYSLFYTACRQQVMLSWCSVTMCVVQPCVAITVNYTTQRRRCYLLPVPPLSPATLNMVFCLRKLQPHLPPSSPPSCYTSNHISALWEMCPESHTDREEEGRMNGEDQNDHRFSWLTSIWFFHLSNPLPICIFNARSSGTSRRRSDISTFM